MDIRNREQTLFAPAERASQETVQAQLETFQDLFMAADLLNAVPDMMVIVNQERQIVFANEALLQAVGLRREEEALGQRVGEVLDCEHMDEMPGGCGTSEFCRMCGAVKAMISSLRGVESIQECRITRKDGLALDFQVWAKPITINGQIFSTFTLKDISSDKRRRVLERLFFHDILNTAGVVQGFAELMQEADFQHLTTISGDLYRVSKRLVEEIQAQRTLGDAENNELTVNIEVVDSLALLEEIVMAYETHSLARNRSLGIDSNAKRVLFESDSTLLRRVIGNMVKNALEAAEKGETVTLSCRADGEAVEFSVHNPGAMPRNVQLQVFQRSFSTKGEGRGIGTYSIKLLTERYLGGRVGFRSTPEEGTRFFARYPLTAS